MFFSFSSGIKASEKNWQNQSKYLNPNEYFIKKKKYTSKREKLLKYRGKKVEQKQFDDNENPVRDIWRM